MPDRPPVNNNMEPQVYRHLRREVERYLFHMLSYANVNKKMMQKCEALPTHIANWGKKLMWGFLLWILSRRILSPPNSLPNKQPNPLRGTMRSHTTLWWKLGIRGVRVGYKKKGPNRTQETKIDGPHIRPNALNVNKIQREATSGFSITEWTTYMEI